MTAQPGVEVDDFARVAAALLRDVPSAKSGVMPVTGPHLVDQAAVELHLVQIIPGCPVFARVVEPEPEFHAPLFAQAQEHPDQVRGRFVTAFLRGEHLRGEGLPAAVAAADEYHVLDTGPVHVSEIGVPLLFAPVLVGNVVADFVQKGSFDLHGGLVIIKVALNHEQM